MYFYRVEHGTNSHIGPYNLNDLPREVIRDTTIYELPWWHGNETHPGMWRDCKRLDIHHSSCDYYCGFHSFESFCAWFEIDLLDMLHRNGFILAVYDIDSCYVSRGTYQSIMIKMYAVRVDTMVLTDVQQLYA